MPHSDLQTYRDGFFETFLAELPGSPSLADLEGRQAAGQPLALVFTAALAAMIVFIIAGAWQTIQVIGARGEPKPGDGEHDGRGQAGQHLPDEPAHALAGNLSADGQQVT